MEGCLFQSSQPVRVGSCRHCHDKKVIIVSIIPTREGWVMNMHYVSCLVCGFNHPNPRGLGRIENNERAITLPVSIIPTREGWVEVQMYNAICEIMFQSSQPARVGSCCPAGSRGIRRGFNHPNPRGLGQRQMLSLI